MNSTKSKEDMTLKDEPPPPVGRWPIGQYATGKSRETAPEGMKRLSQSGNNAQLWMCLVVKVRSDAVKNSIAQEPGMSSP